MVIDTKYACHQVRLRARNQQCRAHFLHIGKTGGTAVNSALSPLTTSGRYEVVLAGHDVDLRQVPAGEKFFFVLRDPLDRFVSAFNDRQRCSRPRYDFGWTLEEERAYAHFHTADELASAMSSPKETLRAAAYEAMTSIYHVRQSYWHWFHDPEYFVSRRDDLLYVLWLPSLQTSFSRLCRLLRIRGAVLPTDDVGAHRDPAGSSRSLSTCAVDNLEQWFRPDLEFVQMCARLRQADSELKASLSR